MDPSYPLLSGGGHVSSGKFKCIFDNEDLIHYFTDEGGQELSAKHAHHKCMRGKAVIVSEAAEFDREQTFATTIQSRLPPRAMCLVIATMSLLPLKRFTLSPKGVHYFAQLMKHSKQVNCAAMFQSPQKIQAVCMNQGVPLSGTTLLSTLWTHFGTASSTIPTSSPRAFAPFIGTLLTEVTLGLKLILDAKLLHGDVKLNNILLYPTPSPIRRYEIQPTQTSDTAKDVEAVGRRAQFQLIDFGRHQTLETFTQGGFRLFARRTMRAWDNPLCLGLWLLDMDGKSDLPTDLKTPYQWSNDELARWIPQIFQQMDKFAFMYIVWQLAYSIQIQYPRMYREFTQSLYTLIVECGAPLPDPLLQEALARVKDEKWTTRSEFRTLMMAEQLVWFGTWDQIYANVTKWIQRHDTPTTTTTRPEHTKTMHSLANYLCPGITA